MAPKKTKLLQNYNFYEVSKDYISKLTDEDLPLAFAVYRKSDYFHTYIIDSVRRSRNDCEGFSNSAEITITVIHKINKTAVTVILSALSGFGKDFSTAIKTENIIMSENDTRYDTHNLFDFGSGVYCLGNYTYEERQEARKRAKSLIGQKQIYSAESANCEHFTSHCFTGIPKSYQSEILQSDGMLVDAGIEVAKNIIPIVGVFSVVHTIKSMKDDVDSGQMSGESMEREAAKKITSTVGGFGGMVGGAAAGAAFGTLVLPGVGTAIGAAIGLFVGNAGGRFTGSLLGTGINKL